MTGRHLEWHHRKRFGYISESGINSARWTVGYLA